MSNDRSEQTKRRYSRRGFLGRLGVGAGAVAVGPAGTFVGTAAAGTADDPPRQSPLNFGRMFSDRLPSFAEATPSVQAALREVGKPGGILDAKDNLAAGPVALIVDPALNLVNRNNDTHTAGTTFVGQFLDHDVTFDVVSALGVPTEPQDTRNARVPTSTSTRSTAGARPSRPSSTTPATGRSSASRAAASSKTYRASRTARRSSPIRATTRT